MHQELNTRKVTEDHASDTQAHVYQGPVTRSRAKLLQKEVNSLLAEIKLNIHENYILPKSYMLTLLRFTKEEDCRLGTHKEMSADQDFTRAKPFQQNSPKETVITFDSQTL